LTIIVFKEHKQQLSNVSRTWSSANNLQNGIRKTHSQIKKQTSASSVGLNQPIHELEMHSPLTILAAPLLKSTIDVTTPLAAELHSPVLDANALGAFEALRSSHPRPETHERRQNQQRQPQNQYHQDDNYSTYT
jgi:hypothetical protein